VAISHGALWERTDVLATTLRGLGLRAGDAVATAMPDGPDALSTWLAVTQVAACAPLDASFQAAEFEFALANLRASALVVPAGSSGPAVAAATAMGLAVVDATPSHQACVAGFAVRTTGNGSRALPPAHAPETALLLHTSATTGSPKLVPLPHAQVAAMVRLLRSTLPEADAGRTLIITPHHHLHCLSSVLIQLESGGAVIATPGFRPEAFHQWLECFRPTQYTAGPTVHRAILSLWPPGPLDAGYRSLRFVTSSGAPLPEAFRQELQGRLGVPVVEGYGLTEAGRVTMTPLDTGQHRPGSVGQCFGPEVAIVDEQGQSVPVGAVGEIVLRGETVITGYAHDPEADREVFRHGWFHTGDLGRLDDDGFLYLHGRLKEAINRGGEKILPYPIEAVLERCPGVAEAAVFAFPHPRLGEDIGAAVVCRPDAQVTALQLREFALQVLAPYKVPRRIVFVAAIPKGRTGKARRLDLAQILQVSGSAAEGSDDAGPPSDRIESVLAGIWGEMLGLDSVDRADDFFLLGGDSLLATTMLARVESHFACVVNPGSLAASATLARLADAVRAALAPPGSRAPSPRCLVTLQAQGDDAPVFLAGASGLWARHLVRHLGRQRPIHILEAPGRGQEPALRTVEELAERFLAELRAVAERRPLWVGGYSGGGLIAWEMARQLAAQRWPVEGVLLIDTPCARRHMALGARVRRFRELTWRQRAVRVRWEITAWQRRLAPPDAEEMYRRATEATYRRYRVEPHGVPALFLCCREVEPSFRRILRVGWQRAATGGLLIRDVPGNHESVVKEPNAAVVAAEINRYLALPQQTRRTRWDPDHADSVAD
jgi:acyl-CoA synthetase (AMP-forming)/AMP-acid ligase II/thioesterase domain-containing protein/acyl carrier protein